MRCKVHPLTGLLGPLRYACGNLFAKLHAVKGLSALVDAAVTKSAGQLPESSLSVLRGAALSADAADVGTRQKALLEVLGVLRAEGLCVDFVPPSMLPAGAAASHLAKAPDGQTPSAPPTQSSDGKRKPNVAKRADSTASEPKSAAQAKPVAAKRRSTRAPQGESEARRLSIAPRAGVLATPLRNMGVRLPPRLVSALKRKGIERYGDLLFLLPRAYEDRRTLSKIAQLHSGQRGAIVATVRHVEERTTRGPRQFRAILEDGSGSIAAVHFQTGSWLRARYPLGKRLLASGEVRQSPYGWEMTHPEIEPAEDFESSSIHFGRVVPVYPGFERHEQRALRELALRVVDLCSAEIDDALPSTVRTELELLPLGEALRNLHFPKDAADLGRLNDQRSPAHERLAFDELFFLQLGLAARRRGAGLAQGIAFDVSEPIRSATSTLFPFSLTRAQRRVIDEVAADMARGAPMSRLIQGDVGSGKTAVAVVASAIAIQNGYQVAVMAPTELLAEQHLENFSKALAQLGVRVARITGSRTQRERTAERDALASGEAQVAVGTHALIEDAVAFRRLGLVIIDEQHRFGVLQRQSLKSKGVEPDVLVMTATPIPRTLAMTLYGDLDVSLIDELPPGRTKVKTRVVFGRAKSAVWAQVEEQIQKGRQVYVVYPLVEESEKVDLADATRGAETIKGLLKSARVGLLHGRLKPFEKEMLMQQFRQHELDVLVSTTVIEVGVDVPNASVMVIEHAERFGLSQLHQLRGRVGRGASESFCLLLGGDVVGRDARERLGVMEQTMDGFALAERDLELRGPGEFLGTRQAGIPELAVANLVRDQSILARAQAVARRILDEDPRLERPEHVLLATALEERWQGRLRLAEVG
jgi:ATP-dependent DNA helicase RecG